MYQNVPFHALPRLHEAIKDQLPESPPSLMKAWKEIEDGKPNNLLLYVENDKLIQKYKINFKSLKPENYVGNIKMRTKKFLSKDLNPIIKKHMKNS